MNSMLLPRYLAVAHYIHQQACPLGSHDIAVAFNITQKMACDDLFKIRQRRDIITFELEYVPRGNFRQILIKIVEIRAYVLDGRLSPRLVTIRSNRLSHIPAKPFITWEMLTSFSWGQLRQISGYH